MSGWEPRGLWGGASQQGCGPYDLSSWALGSSGEALLRERQERNVPGRQTGLPEVLTGCHSFEVRVEEMWPSHAGLWRAVPSVVGGEREGSVCS